MSSKESVFLMIEPYHAYGFEMMKWAFQDFGWRCIVLVEDIYEALHKKQYCEPIPEAWVAAYFHCPRSKVEAVARQLQNSYHIEAVIPWSEPSLELAISLLKSIPMQWMRPEVLARFRNKFDLKNYLRLHHPHIPINASWMIQTADDVEKLRPQLPAKFVIKPLDGMSNQRVGFFTKAQAAKTFIDYFISSGTGRYVLEEYIEGEEFAVNGQTDENGEIKIYSVLRYQHKNVNGRQNVYTRSAHVSSQDPVFAQLTAYVEAVIKALGLLRCPFHAEVRLDPAKGPLLVEVGARCVGNHLVQMMRDAHGIELDPLRIATHFYLSSKPLAHWPLDWARYDATQALNVDGITDKSGLITALSGMDKIEQHPSFRRWVVKPEVGRQIKATQDLLSQPYSFHLATQDPTLNLLLEADALEKQLLISTQGVERSLRWKAILRNISQRVAFKYKWLRFRMSLRG